ncbi:Glyoxylate reductase [Candidatus Anstonella stagnisolia]|nr:Glyoxylate reductase [Candidatus Anstonella stagnisolia]
MKIVIADNMEGEVVAEMSRLGHVEYKPKDLNASLIDAEVLVVRSATKVTAELLKNAPKLKIVARGGVGLDTIDVKECEKRKITVINTPGASTNAVAELAIALMFALGRQIPRADALMRQKMWAKKDLTGSELAGKTLGIIGFGRIGSFVGRKAHALGMKVLYYNDVEVKCDYEVKKETLENVLKLSDFVTLHVPANANTKGMINAERIALMKPSACLVNTARGEIVDEEALYAALKNNKIAGAALDVYSAEPYSGKLLELPNVVFTPHIAGSTKEAQLRIGSELVQKLKDLLAK